MSTPVPVIAVFTKHDQFLRNVQIHLEDYGNSDDNINDVATRHFKEHYLHHLSDDVRFVQLESKFHVRYGAVSALTWLLLWKKCTSRGCSAILFLIRQLKHWIRIHWSWCFWLYRRVSWSSVLERQSSGEFFKRYWRKYSLTRYQSAKHFGLDKNITRDAIQRFLSAFPQIWVSFLFVIEALASC